MKVWGKGPTISSFVKAVSRIAVAGEDRDAVAKILEADGGIDDETLGAADAEIGVEEDDAAWRTRVIVPAGDVVVHHFEDIEVLMAILFAY